MAESRVQPGQTYADFEVVEKAEKKYGTQYWLCRCRGGHELTVSRLSLKLPVKHPSKLFCRECAEELRKNGLQKCTKCGDVKALTDFHTSENRKSGVVPHCKECRKEYDHTPTGHTLKKARSVKHNRQLKLDALKAYGGKNPMCACKHCKEHRVEFLTIDHIDNDGAEHRRAIKSTAGKQLYRWLKRNKYPKGFRVLCMNCNFSCGAYGYCPHDKETNHEPG